MQSMTLNEVAKSCGGKVIGVDTDCDVSISEIKIDSRKVQPGELFVAVIGENNDGHDYIDSAFKNGAVCVVSEKRLDNKPHILVESTFTALKDIAEYYRSLFDIKVIGITGSVGKTTAKEMLASVLAQEYRVLKTEGNFNNEFGLPQMVFKIEKEHDIAVLEMGMSEFGEISRLSKVARPDAALIINIGESHIGNLGSRDNIFKAKCEIFEYMKEGGLVVLNGDDDKLSTLLSMNPVFFGKNSKNDVSLKKILSADIDGTRIIADVFGENLELFIPSPGEYMIYPVLAAVAFGAKFGLTLQQIANGVEGYVPVSQRMNIERTDKLTIIDDAYNASRQSIVAGAETLKYAGGRSIAIVGDVLELGEFGKDIHFQTGRELSELGIDVIVCVGELAKYTWQGAGGETDDNVYYFSTKQELFEKIDDIIKMGDTVFVKASRGMHFEDIVEKLKEL